LPVTPKFKGNAIARYEFPIGMSEGHVQFAASHVGKRRNDVRDFENSFLGDLPAYTTVDISAGIDFGNYRMEAFATNLFDSRGLLSTGVQCLETTCGDPDGISDTGGVFYDYRVKPRVVGIKVGADF
jgi:outer membrane receptor protein involved in Fe transport